MMNAIKRWTNLLRASMLTALLLAGFSTAPATANNYVVNSTADSTDSACDAFNCTLREAIGAANLNAGDDTINFNTTVFNSAKTITLGSALPSFSEGATLTGPPAGVTLDGVTKGFTIFSKTTSQTVRISGLTIINGDRGIYNDYGVLVVVGCTLSGNNNGIEYDRSTVTITNCTLTGNTIGIYSYRENTSTIAGCTISGNGVGVKNYDPFFNPSLITLKNSLVVGNTSANLTGPAFTSSSDSLTIGTAAQAGLDPAGLQNNGGPTKTIAVMPGSIAINAGSNTNTDGFTTDQRGTGYARIYNGRVDIGAFEFDSGPKTFIVNSVADTNDNTCDASSCTLREAIAVANTNFSVDTILFDATVFNSAKTITVGSALPAFTEDISITGSAAGVTVDGGNDSFDIFTINSDINASFSLLTVSNGNLCILNAGTTTITTSTLSGNSSGLRNNGTATVTNSTVSGNQYGIENQGTVTVINSTISGNSVTGFYSDGLATLKNSLIVGNTIVNLDDKGNLDDAGGNRTFGTAAEAGLDPAGLQNNGGPTKTIALMPGSIAVDAGLDANTAGLTTDQRGTGYARIIGSSVDIGAYELSLASLSINDTSITEGNSGTSNATFTITLSKASTQTVTVSYATANGTSNPAMAVGDYTAKSGTLAFAPGVLTQTISVPIVGNYVPEADETFFINLSSPVNAMLTDSQGVGTITNDDFDTTAPTLSFTTSTTTPAGTTPQSGGTVYNVIPAITGVAADAGSGIARVQLRLYRATATAGVYEYWNGTGWVVPGGSVAVPMLSTVLSPGAGSASVTWTRSTAWPTGSDLADGTYYLTAYAYDRAGKFASSARNFKKASDSTGPSVSFTTAATTPAGTTPVSGSTISGTMPTITGIAADSASGIAKVELRLYRATATAGVYENWTGSAWTTTLAALSTIMNPAAGGANVSWSRSNGWPGGGNFADGAYYLRATAYDKAGNLTATLASNFKKVSSAGQTVQPFENDEPSQ